MSFKIIFAGIALSLQLGLALETTVFASTVSKKDVLIQFATESNPDSEIQSDILSSLKAKGIEIEKLTHQLYRLQAPASKLPESMLETLRDNDSVEFVHPNYKIHLLENYQIQDPLKRAALLRALKRQTKNGAIATAPRLDNPEIPEVSASPVIGAVNESPLLKNQWGLLDIGAPEAWKVTLGSPEVVVAVIDTGVDYTHENLSSNIWRNKKEIPQNAIDDDKNGYVDDVIGWDFVSNDNKPYDLSVDPMTLLTSGGNPGHGTHCAGTIAANGGLGLGTSGVAPNVKIMPLRFISEKGTGTTAAAIQAIHYAVDNGAKVMLNSWGSEGEARTIDNEGNRALREAIQYAQDHGVLFITAAGNGNLGNGFDNDADINPSYPASYGHDIIISVAALDSQNQLGEFSNWGARSVDLGAPGVAIYSTTVLGKYDDHVLNLGGFEIMWDGTSMAAPHVAGAAALYWSAHPEKSWQDVKAAVLASTQKIPALKGKVVSEGKLDVRALLK